MEEMQKMCKKMDQTNIPPFMRDMKMQHNEMMEEMQNMCKGDFAAFMKGMRMPDSEMGEMSEMCKNMCKGDFRSYGICQEFMDKFMKK